MNIKLFFLLGTIICSTNSKALDGSYVFGAKAYSLGFCGLLSNDLWSLYNNPGAVALMGKSAVGLSIQNKFGVSKLNAGSLAANLRSDYGSMGLFAFSFGNTSYNQYAYGVSFSRLLIPKFSLGITLYYTGIYVSDYGNFGTPAFNIGCAFPVNDNFSGAFKISNPTSNKISHLSAESTQASAAFGLSHKVASNTKLYLEAEIYESYPLDFRCGIEYAPKGSFYAMRTGFSTLRRSIAIGLSLEKNVKVIVAFTYHNRLGASSTLDTHYYFGKSIQEK